VYQICISGAAKGASVAEGRQLAIAAGQAIAKAGHVLLSGATIGIPDCTAEAYKAAGGVMSVGLSPAASKIEHVYKYRLPTKAYDVILFTGLHYVGRDALLINSADAVVSIGGRLGTLHEFTVAVETGTPIGFLQGAGGISDEIKTLTKLAGQEREGAEILFSNNAEQLIADITKYLDKERSKYKELYN
jgi:hypothetical protein